MSQWGSQVTHSTLTSDPCFCHCLHRLAGNLQATAHRGDTLDWAAAMGILTRRWGLCSQPGVCLRSPGSSTAPLTTVSAAASGTFNPLHGVLCILRSLYLCSIGPRSIGVPYDGYTSHFKLQYQAALLEDPASQSGEAMAHSQAVWDIIPQWWSIPGLSLVPSGPPNQANQSKAHRSDSMRACHTTALEGARVLREPCSG